MNNFNLTSENYYSAEADKRFMSVHQYLDFVGHMGVYGCEARAMAKLNGEWKDKITKAMLVGSFVDSYFEGSLDSFLKENQDCFLKTKPSELKAEYRKARIMIERCKQDELFMKYMSGEKQTIMTFYLFGCEWKMKMDSYIPGKAIVDLKTANNIHRSWKVQDYGNVCFVEYWGYILQLAVYQKGVEINTGQKLPCYLAVVTKDEYPEIEIVYIDQKSLDHALHEIEMNMQSVLMVKSGEVDAIRCEKCDYCKSTKKIEKPIHYMDLISE